MLLLTTASQALAQGRAVPGLSAAQFLGRVAQSNPRNAIAEAEIEVAAARVSAAGLWENPTLAYEREEVFAGSRGLPENTLRLELPIEISGRRGLRVQSAERGVTAARADAVASRVALLAEAARVYFRAAAYRERLDILRKSRDALAGLHKSTAARAAAGDASGYDLTRIEIELSTLDDLIADAEQDLARARLQMGLLVGQPGTQFEATDPLTTGATAAVKKRSPTSRATPRVAALRHRVAQHRLNRDAAGRGWVPGVTLSGGAKTAPGVGETAWGYVAGVAISIPIFDHGQADKKRANAELRRAGAILAATEQATTTNVAIAGEAHRRAASQVRTFERGQLARVSKLTRIVEASYKEGERPVFEVLDAHRVVREVRGRHVLLKLKARLGYITLLEALGREPQE